MYIYFHQFYLLPHHHLHHHLLLLLLPYIKIILVLTVCVDQSLYCIFKAASVIRMMRDLLGEDVFIAGLNVKFTFSRFTS